MKTRTILSALCLSAIAAISCSKEENEPRISGFEPLKLDAVSEQTGKTHLDGCDVIWDSGDDLSAFSADAATHTNNKLECTSFGTTTASFSGYVDEGTTSFYAVYPYVANLSYNNGVISGASIPSTQTATPGSFANGVSLALAHGERVAGQPDCGTLSFKNLCSILSFTLPENITFADKIVVTSKSGTGMAGAVSINCSSMSISGASSSSVTLNGSFTGGSTYYIAIAPGTYTNGFSFTITTTGGNSYSRETTKTVPALAGSVYPLGTLSLALGQDAFSTSMSISHDVASNTLNGSTAKFNLSFNKAEFSLIVKNVSTTVTLKNGSSAICRSKTISGTSASNVTLDMQNGFHYLPKGDYTYTAEVTYTVNNGTKDVQRVLVYNGNVTSPQPASFAIDANFTGYTSYSDYKGTDGCGQSTDNANSRDGSTIYNIGATYKSGLSPDVYNQCSGLLSVASTLDGNAASGNAGSQSWAAHTIGATWSFDGAGGTCASTKTVYVTGLPYYIRTETATPSGWTTSGTEQANNEKYMTFGNKSAGTTASTYAISPKFKIPGEISASCNIHGYVYCSSAQKSKIGVTLYVTASDTDTRAGEKIGNKEITGENGNIISIAEKYDHVGTVNFTKDSSVCIHADVRRDKTTLVIFAYTPGMITEYIRINYR